MTISSHHPLYIHLRNSPTSMVFMRFGTSVCLSSRHHLRTNLVPPQHGVSSPGITCCSRATRPMRPHSPFRAAASSTTGTSVARTRRMLAHRPSQKQYLRNETLCRLCMPFISPRLIYHLNICKHRKNPTVKGWIVCKTCATTVTRTRRPRPRPCPSSRPWSARALVADTSPRSVQAGH